MGNFFERLGPEAPRLLGRLLAWHWRSWQEAWGSAWQGPHKGLRLLGPRNGASSSPGFVIQAVF